MSTQSALGGTRWVATRRRTRRRERAAVPTNWEDPVVAVQGFVTDPMGRLPNPGTGVPLPRYRPRPLASSLFRATLLLLVLALVAGAAAVPSYLRYRDEASRADAAEARAAASASELRDAATQADSRAARIATMRERIALLETQMTVLAQSKVKTVVVTETVTEEVIRWVPNGEAVVVELTGFDGLIGIHDVQITQAYGFTDIVGIAVNESGNTISYAQLGCTFLDADGKVLANAITNKQGWAPDQSWGFTCSAPVDATGAILRVDEMS